MGLQIRLTQNVEELVIRRPEKSSSSIGISSDIVLGGEKSREGISEYEDEKAVVAAIISLRWVSIFSNFYKRI